MNIDVNGKYVQCDYNKEENEYNLIRKKFWNLNAKRQTTNRLKTLYAKRLREVYSLNIPKEATILDIGCGNGDLLASLSPKYGCGIDFSEKILEEARKRHPHLTFIVCNLHKLNIIEKFDYIILSDVVNDIWDIQKALTSVLNCSHQNTKVIINFQSQLWKIPLSFARKLKLATPVLQQNWVTFHDIDNLLQISGFEQIKKFNEIVFPLPVYGQNFLNKVLSKLPLFRHLALANFVIARPKPRINNFVKPPTVSIIVAARNEAGHIKELIDRIPDFKVEYELIFVEGNSTDNTYQVIESIIQYYPNKNISLYKQPGNGKGDAVRMGFKKAKGDILIILDADISVPPEDLTRFYSVIANGEADFINGVRLVYPMQDDAMRFANLIGNKFFAYAFSWLLGQQIRDTLCGSKALRRSDYIKIAANRNYFGDFDPFGDFDLLFGAAKLNLKIVEVPIRYRARTYGVTNIKRWSHGLLLLRMIIFASRKIKFV